MKIRNNVTTFLLAFFSLHSAMAQTTDDIIERHVKALGGRDIIAKIGSIEVECTVHAMGSDAPSVTTILDGKGVRYETTIGTDKMITVFTADGGWSVNTMMGSNDPQQMKPDRYHEGFELLFIGGPLYDYASRGSKAELLATGTEGYKIRLTNKYNISTTIYLDTVTLLIKKIVQQGTVSGQPAEIIKEFSDYRRTDAGLLYPMQEKDDYGGKYVIAINASRVRVNQRVDPAVFQPQK
jgi:hypothetical protein